MISDDEQILRPSRSDAIQNIERRWIERTLHGANHLGALLEQPLDYPMHTRDARHADRARGDKPFQRLKQVGVVECIRIHVVHQQHVDVIGLQLAQALFERRAKQRWCELPMYQLAGSLSTGDAAQTRHNVYRCLRNRL